MREEQKIILSLYYADPKVEPSNIKEAKFSVGMDVAQLLLLMEGVFDKVEYKYYITDRKIRSEAAGDRKKEYQVLIEQSNPELKEAQVIAVMHSGRKDFQDLDYIKIDSYNIANNKAKVPGAKDNLYFLNVLVRNVNGIHMLGNRETLIFYRLFSYRNGKEFISCLLSMMVKLISALLKGEMEEADEVVAALNKDYELMRTIYKKEGQSFLENMKSHEQRMRGIFPENFFCNQSDKFRTWVADHQDTIMEGDILEFVFYKNEALKNYTRHLMLHIVKISRMFMKDEHRAKLLEKNFKLNDVPQMSDFHHLDQLVEELEEEGMKSSFDMIRWANEYNARLYASARELRLL